MLEITFKCPPQRAHCHGELVEQFVDLVVLVQRMTRCVETAVVHQKWYVQMPFLGGSVRHQLHLKLQK
jgi:hypothetical protein